MIFNKWKFAFVVLLSSVIASGFASQQLRAPRSPTAPTLVQTNRTFLSLLPQSLNFHAPPPDPWTYLGPTGRYRLFNYHTPHVRLSWLATFFVTCMGDVYDAIANQGFKPDEPYPDGRYKCQLDYMFPFGSSGIFALEITKLEAPDWYMTFSNVMDDLEALWYAALWFEDRPGGAPGMDFEVFKFNSKGISFLAARGSFGAALTVSANVTEA